MRALGIAILSALILAGSALGSTKTLVVAMKDPGCHWFLVHGKYLKSYSTKGPVNLKDMDEAALKIASRSGMRHVAVGHSIKLTRGHYVIMMKGQAVDDNYLKLTVK